MQNVQQNLGFFFKQESRIQNQLIDLINARFGSSDDFYQNRIKLDLESASNEKIENLVKLKRTFAYFNQNVYDEIIRIFKNQFEKFSENFGRLAQNESVSIMEVKIKKIIKKYINLMILKEYSKDP